MPPFDGETYSREIDGPRLKTQLEAVKVLAQTGRWWTLEELAASVTGLTGKRATEASVSARLRDLRKDKFGSYDVARERVGETGLWRYQISRPAPTGEQKGMF